MNRLLSTTLRSSLLLLTFSLSAAIPQRWTVETSRVQPAQFEAYHGETIEFAATMQTYGKPLAITNDLIGLYWQTNGMGSVYWPPAPAVLSNNVMIARWTPQMDVGEDVYNCFIGAPGENYRAAFKLRLYPSPGAVPSELPLPVRAIDFAQVEVRNAPYYTKAETDARIIELAPPADLSPAFAYTTAVSNKLEASKQDVIADLASIRSGAALGATAVQPAAISDMETQTHAAATYQPKGSYLTSESDPSVDGKISTHNSSPSAHSDIRTALAGKQPTISDLASIRSGAALGATAVQPAAISDMETQTHAAATYQPKGSYLTTESDPSVDGKISTHNTSTSAHADIRGAVFNAQETASIAASFANQALDSVGEQIYYHNQSTSAHADIRNTVNNLADNVSTWSSFWSGDGVRVTVTNFGSAVNLPSLYIEYKLSNGLFRTVWDERTRWNANELRMAALESAVEGKADRAWGYYDSHTGGWAPDGYTWLSSPKIAISGGMAYQKHVTSEGAVWVLESNGLIAESGGVMSNGFFRISDDEGNPLFEVVKGNKRTVGATAGSCEPLTGYAITHLQIGYAVESADHPKIYVTRSLTPVDWKDEEDADCPATVSWSGSSGNWSAVVAGKVAEAKLFVKAEYEVGGNTYIKQSAPVSVQKLVLGGNEYRVGTATISGHTVLTLTLEP